MKLSEVIEAIDNGTFEVDVTDNMDVVIMTQTVVDETNIEVRGVLEGNDNRIAILFADRMVKSEGFRNIISEASKYYIKYMYKKRMEAEESNNETAEE